MTVPPAGLKKLIILLVIVGAGIALLENSPLATPKGSLLLTLVFWGSVIQGCVAVVAVCELTNAKWIKVVKKELLAVTPLLYFMAFLFLLLGTQMDLYPWAEEKGIWLNKGFFLTRNFIVLFLTALAGTSFAAKSRRRDDALKYWAVVYLFLFVLSQSLVAYDWVMSLAYPWYSTLFGPYFFVEAIYVGIAVSGMLFLFVHRKDLAEGSRELNHYLRDVATMMFGFSILWGGLFFSQFLVIWYGNLPEEVSFIVDRVSASPFRELSYLILVTYFVVPFLVLLPRRPKDNPYIVSFVSLAILSGIFIERLVFLKPVVPFGIVLFLLELAGILLLFVLAIRSGEVRSSDFGG
jgi:hypothetical protein